MTTFLLGLSVGGGCLTHCGPALLPMLLCEKQRRLRLAVLFLAARLLGYSLVATVVFLTGKLAAATGITWKSPLLEGLVFILLGLYLWRYSLRIKREVCGSGKCDSAGNAAAFGRFRESSLRFAVGTGFLTGLGLCAPMIAIVAEGLSQTSFTETLAAFLFFYLGTTTVLIPLFIGGFAYGGRNSAIRQIGFLGGLLAAALYLVQGSYILILEIIHGCF